jgi:hypothetical protein
MKRSKFSEHEIVAILKEADAGASVKEVCGSAGSARRPTTSGSRSTGALRRRI